MPLDADSLVARRKMRRRISFWRIAAFVLGGIALIAVTWAAGSNGGFDLGKQSSHVARIRIEGMITGKASTLELLKEIEKAAQVKALLVHIDSPGGTTSGSEAIYENLRTISRKKPVVAIMDTVAASGGYITAIGADHIVARGNTITGSIGVIFQWAQVKDLLANIGVQFKERKSGDVKAEPSPFAEPSEKSLAITDAMIKDSFNWFTGLVKERRKLNPQQMALISDGRVFTGRQALDAKLIDAIGGPEKAREWLLKEHEVPKDLKVVDWKPKSDDAAGSLGLFGLRVLARALGFEGLFQNVSAKTIRLDGLLALWHPDL